MTELSDSQVPDTQPWNRISKGYPSTTQVMDFTFTEGHAVGSKFTYNVQLAFQVNETDITLEILRLVIL